MLVYTDHMDLEKYRILVDKRIDEWLTNEQRLAPEGNARLLLERVQKLIKRGGKRARPQLFYLTYKGYGGDDNPAIVDVGASLELHHQFLLIHDDIMDRDTVRYDGPNITGSYLNDGLSENIATSMALLAGDVLFSYASQIILESQLSPTKKTNILYLLSNTNTKVQQGQLLDILNDKEYLDNFSDEKAVKTHELKTASYTTGLPMLTAASLLHLKDAEKSKIELFAQSFGLFFQFVDDFSDYFENPSVFNNRPKYRDFRQGKITTPLNIALKNMSADDSKFLLKWFGDKKTTDKTLIKVIELIKQNGGEDIARRQIKKYHDATVQHLMDLSLYDKQKQMLFDIINSYRVDS